MGLLIEAIPPKGGTTNQAMTPERWKQVEEIFNATLDRPVDEREAFLAEACGDDPSLRQQVEHLINCHEQAGDFIEAQVTSPDSTLQDDAVTLQLDLMIGRQVGAYKLVREIGRGGMGAVYLAVRADNQFRQRAAIKLVKRGMDTDFVIRRFRNERQILAALNHPNIARLLDGGATDDGLPYFVMEYIEGMPIHRYCDTRRLTVAERLKLFRQVCAAAHYAHENQVIHRDIKPGNILVTEDGTPKLLDFGIAKILDPDLAADTMDPTVTAMRLMTPEYASPEQARGEQVTAATDQYSLGVLLYELLTGHRPYQLRRRAAHEIARVISEEEPERPSEMVSRTREATASDGKRTIELSPKEISRDRNSSPEELRRELTGGLDDIVMRALRKEPQRRYGSTQDLSQDINLYLQGLPVTTPAYVAVAGQYFDAETAALPVMSEPDRAGNDPSPIVEAAILTRAARKTSVIYAAVIAVIAASALFFYFRPRATQPDTSAPADAAVRLTNSLSDETLPKVSPDGTKIAFLSNDDGTYELYVMNVDGSGLRRLTSNSLQEGAPAWSPDGRLVFGSTRDFNPEIYITGDLGNLNARPAAAVVTKSVAVLPFRPKVPSETEKLLGVGLADVTTNKLGQIKQLSVRPASASRNYLESDLDPRRIGAELGVEYVIGGALSRDGASLSLELWAFSLRENRNVWEAKIDEKLKDITALQSSIAEGILRFLMVEPGEMGQRFFVKGATEDSEAYQLYLAGRYHWGKRSVAGINEAIKSFEGAIRRDPKFAPAYAGLADCYTLLQLYQTLPPSNSYRRAKENALKALDLDDSLAEAHASLAYVKFHFDRDRRGAEASFRRAIDLNPSYATAHHWLAISLSAMGRHDEAIAAIKDAERLDPRSAIIKTAAGMIYTYARRFDRGLDECRRALELNPALFQAHRMMRWIYQATGRYNDAFAAYLKEREFSPGATEDDWLVVLAQLQAVGARREEAQVILKRGIAASSPVREGDFQPFEIAVAYALLGEHDRALEWLAKSEAVKSYNFNFALVDPRLDNLRSDPRFIGLMKKAGFQD